MVRIVVERQQFGNTGNASTYGGGSAMLSLGCTKLATSVTLAHSHRTLRLDDRRRPRQIVGSDRCYQQR